MDGQEFVTKVVYDQTTNEHQRVFLEGIMSIGIYDRPLSVWLTCAIDPIDIDIDACPT